MWDSQRSYKLLLTDTWRKRRKAILERDKFVCQDCSNAFYFRIPFQNKEAVPVISMPFDILEVHETKDNVVSWCPVGHSDFHAAVQLALALQKTVIVVYKGYAVEEDPYALFCVDQKVADSVKGTAIVSNSSTISRAVYTLSDLNEKGLFTWLYARNLQVHHIYYQQGYLPWDYPDSALITLCQECHHKRHEKSSIPVIDSRGNIIDYVKPNMLRNVDDDKPAFMKTD